MLQCKNCRVFLPDHASFCSDCGQPLIAQSDTARFLSDHKKIPTQSPLPYNNDNQPISGLSDTGIWLNDVNTFDILLQFDQSTMKDLQIRSLNTSLTTGLWLKSPISRVIDHPIAPLEIKAHWNKPHVSIDENQVEIRAEVKGGARQALTGHILTIDGEVSTKQNVIVESDNSGRPYVCLKAPDPLHLHMKKLKVTYEGSTSLSLLAKLNPTREETALRPVLTKQLMAPLAGIPLTFFPRSLPVGTQSGSRTPTTTVPVTQAMTSIVQKSGSLILGLMLDTGRTAPTIFTTQLPEKSQYNAALSISTSGLNALINHLCNKGEAAGEMYHSLWGDLSWQWEHLSVILRQGSLQLAGILRQRGQRTAVQAEAQCMLDRNGVLHCIVTASNTDAAISEIVQSSWITLLRRLLAVPDSKEYSQDPNAHGQLWQCFEIPGTQNGVEAMALYMHIVHGQLVVFYHIPKTHKKPQLDIIREKPTITLVQTHIPQQPAHGAPVTLQIEAKRIKESTAPYDHVWTTGLSHEPKLEHEPRLTLTEIPKPAAKTMLAGGEHALTSVHLKVIDMFGEVSEVHGSAKYIPYRKKSHKTRKGPKLTVLPNLRVAIPSLIVIAALILIVLLLLPRFSPSSAAGRPSVSMPDTVDTGQKVMVKGSDFPPLLSAIITIDTPHSTNRTFQPLTMQQPTQYTQHGTTVTVNKDGTFQVSFYIDPLWSPSIPHTLYVLGKDDKPLGSHKFTINGKPCITVEQSSLPFAALQGQDNPVSQILTAKNCGDAGTVTASVSTHDGGTWLSATGGGNFDSSGQSKIKVSVNTQGLSAGSYTGSVTVTSKDTNEKTAKKQIAVNLKVSKQCSMNASSTAPPFTAEQGGNNPPSQTFTVVSSCPGTVTTSVSTNDGGSWLSADSGGQVDPSSPLKIKIFVNALGLSTGSYTGFVTVTFNSNQDATHGLPVATALAPMVLTSNEGFCASTEFSSLRNACQNTGGYKDTNEATTTQQVTVNLTVSPPCTITANQTSLAFTTEQGGYNPGSQTISLVSSCVGTITTSVSTNDGRSWLSADKGGTLASSGQFGIDVSVNDQGLSAGSYTGAVTVTFNDANGVTATQQVTVNFTITPPCTISVNPTSLSFIAEQGGNNPPSQSFTVTNPIPNCSGTVTTSITGGSWLSADSGGHVDSSNPLVIKVSVNTQGLSAGSYSGSVTTIFNDVNGVTATQSVTVNFTITPPCTISVNPTSLSFIAEVGGNNPPSQSFTVTNPIPNCSGTVTTSITGGSWLSADSGGHVDSSNPLGINVSVNVQGLSAGQYPGSVTATFKDANGVTATATVGVTLTVIQQCTISASPNSLLFTTEEGGYDPPSQSFTVTNPIPNCSGTVTTSVNGGSWLSADSGGHVDSSTSLGIKVYVNAQGLTAGSYSGSVTATYTDAYGVTAAATVSVTVTILPPCTITANPNSLTFTTEQGASAYQSFTVSTGNNCAGTITTSVVYGGSWLNADSGGQIDAANPLGIKVYVNTQGLSAGSYSGSVTATYTDAYGAFAYATVSVTLTVNPPCLSVYPTSVTTSYTSNSLTLTDCGATAGTLQISASTTDGGSWLSATSNPTSLSAGGTSTLTITINTQNLLSNTLYTGQVDVVMTDIYGITTSVLINVSYELYLQ